MSEQNNITMPEPDFTTTSNETTATTPLTRLRLATHPALRTFSNLSMPKQISLMLGLALSVAIGIAIVLWSQEPSYSRLYADVEEQDLPEILNALDTREVKYKLEAGKQNRILVPAEKVDELKLELAAQGVPKKHEDGTLGYELLDKEQGFGTSKNVESARFQRALEGEIARTITSIQAIKSARVLLALPVQSVFVRERKKPSASVFVNLHKNAQLDAAQIESIVNLVASSVPQLDADHVTVVDQKGTLLNNLTKEKDANKPDLSETQFAYKKNIEEHLMHRIENLLSPVVGGSDAMRAQISADVDFTETDKTQEIFNPDFPALRSEQVTEEKGNVPAIGVPGALSNQPTPAGTSPEVVNPEDPKFDKPGAVKSATRNFELDKTVTHTKLASGILRRLSVAVVVDDRKTLADDGSVKTLAYSQEDINRFNDLVKQAVGFDASRGDQVTVSNVSFSFSDNDVPEEPLWKQSWFLDLAKQVVAVLAVLFLIFGVLRPAVRSLIARDEEEKRALQALEDEKAALEAARLAFIESENEKKAAAEAAENGEETVQFDEFGNPIALLEGQQEDFSKMDELLASLDVPKAYQHRLEYVKNLIDDDPKVVAEVMKSWVKKDG